MDEQFVIPEKYKDFASTGIAIKLLEHYLENEDDENRVLITYGDLCKKLSFDMNPRNIERPLGNISFACKDNGLPPISALVVEKDGMMPGPGFFKAYCPGVKGNDRINVWMDIFQKIRAYNCWEAVLSAYRSEA